MEISHNLIKSIETFLKEKKNIPISYPKEMREKNIFIEHEKKEFIINLQILNESIEFLRFSFDLYLNINSEVKENFFSKNEKGLDINKFKKLKQFLDRCRFSLNNVLYTCKNYIEDTDFQEQLYETYKNNLNSQKICLYKNILEKNKYKKEKLEELNKNKRLDYLLNKDYIFNKDEIPQENKIVSIQRKKEKHIDFESKKFDKMLKYLTPEAKNLIKGQRALLMYNNKKN